MDEHFDVIIIGAGIAGVCAAYHLQERMPEKSFTIVEARDAIGGTWDLFRYPGIRSDSDMYTLGFPFRPWRKPESIADGADIRAYVQETAAHYGIDRKVRFGQRLRKAAWSSEHNRWSLVCDTASGEARYTCQFMIVGAGYYKHEAGYTPSFEGMSDFRGRVVHPQRWTSDVEYAGKRVVVIGSGATAFGLVPALAQRAAHVVMLQRSPTYVFAAPRRDPTVEALRRRLPAALSDSVARWRSILLGELFFRLSRVMPETMRRALIEDVQKALGPSFDVAKHFTPNYNVWDQRVCLIADGDFYAGLRDGKVSIVTDRVARFTQTGLLLESGQEIDADLIVTATGLELQMMGGAEIEVDGRRVDFSKLLMYKGCMYTGVPNLAGLSGHTNASWTLKVELTCGWLCRLLARMDAVGAARCTPHRNDPSVREEPLLEFSSGYVQRALSSLPKQGSKAPFRLYQSYLLDLLLLRLGKIEDANLEFAGASSALRPPSYTTTRWRAHPRIRAAARAPS